MLKAKVKIDQLRSTRQFMADILNPQRMTTITFFKVVRKMIEVQKLFILTCNLCMRVYQNFG